MHACTDGSTCPDTGNSSHSWVFANGLDQIVCSGAGPDDGHPTLMSSYRLELGGLLASVYIFIPYATIITLISKVTLYCDNKGALTNALKRAPPGISPYTTSDYDLLGLLRHFITIITVTILGEWVRAIIMELIDSLNVNLMKGLTRSLVTT